VNEPARLTPAAPAAPTRVARSARRDAPPLVPAVTRALTLMDFLSTQRQPMSLSRLSVDLGLPKSSVHGLCHTLASFGYLRRHADGSFDIGPRVLGLAEAFVAGTDVAQEFNALWGAAAEPAETMVLSMLSGHEVLYVAARQGSRPLGLAFKVGMRLPAHLAATGRAMLAWREPGQVRQMFAQHPPVRLTGRGPQSVEALLDELATVRERGLSVDDETVREGVYCVGAPVFDAAGQAVAGVGVCVSKSLLDDAARQALGQSVLDTAERLSLRLGGHARPGPATAPQDPSLSGAPR